MSAAERNIVPAVFDGKVFRPDTPPPLEPNTRCLLTVEVPTVRAGVRPAWDVLAEYAGSVDASADWSAEHDHYLYGSPKRGP
jgi:hypothetical protein